MSKSNDKKYSLEDKIVIGHKVVANYLKTSKVLKDIDNHGFSSPKEMIIKIIKEQK